MALQGFMVDGSYTTVSNVIYNKDGKSIGFDVIIYKDSNKGVVINSFRMDLSGENPKVVDEIKDIHPGMDEHTSYRVLYKTSNNTLDSQENHIFEWNDESTMDYMPPQKDEVVYVVPEDKRYVWRESLYRWEEANEYSDFDDLVFDKYFGLNVMQQDGFDVIKVVYIYLKARPEFAGCTDV